MITSIVDDDDIIVKDEPLDSNGNPLLYADPRAAMRGDDPYMNDVGSGMERTSLFNPDSADDLDTSVHKWLDICEMPTSVNVMAIT